MSNLTFADILSDVYAHCGLDSSDATNIANATRWANYVQQDICARWPWSFMRGRETVVTVPDYSTGTVAISLAGTAVTGTSTVWTTAHGDGTYYMQFSGANDWYRVASRSSNTAVALSTAYQGTVALTAATYTLRKFFYALSSSADRIIDIRNWNTPLKLVQVDARTADGLYPLAQSTNSSYGYIAYGYDSSGNLQITPYPFPSDARLFEVRTNTRPVDGAISIPNKYAHIIAWGAIAVGMAYLRKFQEAALWSQKFEARITDMKREDRRSEDYQPILRSIDDGVKSNFQPMPDQYPAV